MLDGRKTKENLRARFPTDRKPYTNDYEYEDDSDLEEGKDILDGEPVGVPQVATEKLGNDPNVATIESSDAGSDNEPSDTISISDLNSLLSGSSDAEAETGIGSSAHIGKVVVVEDVAFVT